MYTQDYDDKYPPASKWADVTIHYTKGPEIYICPSVRTNQQTYAVNIKMNIINRKEIKSPMDTVCIYDSIPGFNQTGGPELVPYPGRHSAYLGHELFSNSERCPKGNNIGFADGHVRWFLTSNNKYNWDP